VWFASAPVFFGAAVILTIAAAHEFVDLAGTGGVAVPRFLTRLAATLTMAVANLETSSWILFVTLLVTCLALAMANLGSWRGGPQALATVSVSFFPSLHQAPDRDARRHPRDADPPCCFSMLPSSSATPRNAPPGRVRAAALAPAISPKKTVGAVSGFVFGAGARDAGLVAAGGADPDPRARRRRGRPLGIAGDLSSRC
jgi:hypothetical protein